VQVYLDTNADRLLKTVAAFGSRVMYRVGFTRVQSELPVVSAMSTRWALSMVLSLLLDIIAMVLLFLSGVLVYALMGVDVQRRTVEMGVLRLLGARRRRLVALMLVHAASYAVPSLVAGLIVSQCFMPIIAAALELLSGVPASSLLSSDAVLRAMVVGLAVPGLAAIVPISRALQTRVADALGSDRGPAPTEVVQISRSEVRCFLPFFFEKSCDFFFYIYIVWIHFITLVVGRINGCVLWLWHLLPPAVVAAIAQRRAARESVRVAAVRHAARHGPPLSQSRHGAATCAGCDVVAVVGG